MQKGGGRGGGGGEEEERSGEEDRSRVVRKRRRSKVSPADSGFVFGVHRNGGAAWRGPQDDETRSGAELPAHRLPAGR